MSQAAIFIYVYFLGLFCLYSDKHEGNSFFPRIEEMAHFHYGTVDFSSPLQVIIASTLYVFEDYKPFWTRIHSSYCS